MTDISTGFDKRIPVAGFLAWLVPGLGHIYLGYKKRGLVLLVTITVTFWSGVAIGGVRGTVQDQIPRPGKGVGDMLWFAAELCSGGNHLLAMGIPAVVGMELPTRKIGSPPPYVGHWLSIDVGVHYAGVAGLLNLLVIFDAIMRADPSFRRKGEAVGTPAGSS